MNNEEITILSIDTSCDDTSVAITRGQKVLANCVSSQIEMHKKTGGVVPINASRAHEIKLDPLIKFALSRAKISQKDLNAIAVTHGPGLAPALEVGIQKAKKLALNLHIPLIPVNHMSGHAYANWAQNSLGKNGILNKFKSDNILPSLVLLISGGHTEIVLMESDYSFKIVGETLDDACGECFDKVGRMMGLGYPAGPVIEKFAESGDENTYILPHPLRNSGDLNVSYSGLKTAAFRLIKSISEDTNSGRNSDGTKTTSPSGTEVFNLTKQQIQDFCASFQKAAIETILHKVEKAIDIYKPKTLLLGGGVVKNKDLRKSARNIAKSKHINFHYPAERLIMDNAAMIGISAYHKFILNKEILRTEEEIQELERSPGLRL